MSFIKHLKENSISRHAHGLFSIFLSIQELKIYIVCNDQLIIIFIPVNDTYVRLSTERSIEGLEHTII